MSDHPPIIELSKVAFSYPDGITLFRELSLSLEAGRFYLISGPSGSGKSTFLRLINRLEEPSQGDILFNGRKLSVYNPPELRRSLLYIQQTPTAMDNTVEQNLLLGFILKFVFELQNAMVVLAIFGFMIFFAAWEIRARVKERQVAFFWPVFVSMAISYTIVSYLVTTVMVNVEPWWKPQYFIPLAGMVIGNSMNAVAIALERLLGDLRKRRLEVEARLCLGADYKEASQDMFRNAMRAGMIPSINSMMGAGIVFIPGMMTGQILAGADPLLAIRYQIIVMVMLVGSTAIGTLLVVYLVRKLCFGPGGQLVLRPKNR